MLLFYSKFKNRTSGFLTLSINWHWACTRTAVVQFVVMTVLVAEALPSNVYLHVQICGHSVICLYLNLLKRVLNVQYGLCNLVYP